MTKSTYSTNEQIEFTFWSPKYPDNAWIGIIPASVAHGSERVNDQYDRSYHYLRGATTGTWKLRNPGKGQWTVRLHDTDNGNTGKEVAYAPFSVR